MFGRTNSKQDNKVFPNRDLLCYLVLFFVSILSASITDEVSAKTLIEISNINKTSASLIHKIKVVEKPGVIMTITAYNAGDPQQTDDRPCESATGDDICELLRQGINTCALNSVPLRSIIKVKGLGECIVLDRTSSKYKNRVDWAMKLEEKDRAIKFGRQNLEVSIIYQPND